MNNKEKNFLSAVIYLHNNQHNIENFLLNLNNLLSKNFEKFEIICVNDDSSDKTIDIIKQLVSKLNNNVLTVINMSFFQGLEASINAGVDMSIGDFVFEFDNIDIDYDINTAMELYNLCIKGSDIVTAISTKQKLSSTLFYKLYNNHSNTQYKLESESFRIISRRAINRIQTLSKTIPYRKALYSNCGLKISKFEYQTVKKIDTKRSKQQKAHRKGLAIDSLILFTNIAYKISMIMTIIMMIATLVSAVYTVVIFISHQPIQGYTTIMLVITGSFFGVFAILAIIIKYLSVLINLVYKKNKYIIESIENITN